MAGLSEKAGDGDFLRAVAEAVLQLPMEADVEGLIGAGRHKRSMRRLNYRNGYRERTLDTGSARCSSRWRPGAVEGSHRARPQSVTAAQLASGL